MLTWSPSRRQFLALGLSILLHPRRLFAADPSVRRGPYSADVGILYSMFTFHLEGAVEETVDRAAGRYEVKVVGQGDGVANRIESSGELRDGRWVPLRGASWFSIRGRESRTRITYDYDRRQVEYHARGETFFLRRLRVVDDVIALPEGTVVDDALTASLNYRHGYWKPQPDGRLKTHIVRRKRSDNEGPDDVAGSYKAELLPLELRVEPEPETRKPSALLDLSGFSSWARKDKPARIVFDEQRRPALITGTMALGTSLTIRLS
jgi:hypothetical protein